jgi:hypothetical protein
LNSNPNTRTTKPANAAKTARGESQLELNSLKRSRICAIKPTAPRMMAAQKVECLGGVKKPEDLVLVPGTVLRLTAGADFGADDLLLDFGVLFAETVLDLDLGLDFVAICSP